MCHALTLTVVYVPFPGRDCLICAMHSAPARKEPRARTEKPLTESGRDCLTCAMFWP